MTARKIKHARALAKREEFMKTVKEGDLKVLNAVRDQRAEHERKLAAEAKERKIEKSKRLAEKYGKAQTTKRRQVPDGYGINGSKEEVMMITSIDCSNPECPDAGRCHGECVRNFMNRPHVKKSKKEN